MGRSGVGVVVKAEVMRTLVELGADALAADRQGLCPLHAAAAAGHVEALRVLCEVGGGVHHADVKGATALHHATEQGEVGAVRMLISLGADVQAPDSQGDTALHVAASKGQVRVCSPFPMVHGPRPTWNPQALFAGTYNPTGKSLAFGHSLEFRLPFSSRAEVPRD